MTADTDAARRQLQELLHQISAAEFTLQTLRTAILAAHSEQGLAAAVHARLENERLQLENHLATQQVQSAHAALEVAVKASQTDFLTGLCNREVLWDRLTYNLALARRSGQRLVVYFLDIDGFKRVNDKYGHAVGDLLLQCTGAVLQATMRDSDTVCRIGGDEFVVLTLAGRYEDAGEVADKIGRALGQPRVLGGHPMCISASIGFSVFPDDGESPGVLMHKADEAMYRIKRAAASRQR